ncbi:uncharacterized protein LOC141912064 [Tubulanus polymorphus]|uniref:uncharacterized protein LOC141912064 n=1 Tax=Tubulanus polymorphus TaxID=672921 RepID=UPI003DA2C470
MYKSNSKITFKPIKTQVEIAPPPEEKNEPVAVEGPAAEAETAAADPGAGTGGDDLPEVVGGGIDRSLFPMAFTSDSQEKQAREKVKNSDQSATKGRGGGTRGRGARGGGTRGVGTRGGGARGGGAGGARGFSLGPVGATSQKNNNDGIAPKSSALPSLFSIDTSSHGAAVSAAAVDTDAAEKKADADADAIELQEDISDINADIRSMLPMSFSANTKKEANFERTATNANRGQGQGGGRGGWRGHGGDGSGFGGGRGRGNSTGQGNGWNGNQGGWNGYQGGWNGNQGGWNGNQGGWNGNQGGWNGNQGGWNGNQGGWNGGQGGGGERGGWNSNFLPSTQALHTTPGNTPAERNRSVFEVYTGLTDEFRCEICDVACTSESTLKTHQEGRKHLKNVELIGEGGTAIKSTKREKRACRIQSELDKMEQPLIGLDYITEYQKEDPKVEARYICSLCESKMDPRNLVNHLIGFKHRYQYMKIVDPFRAQRCADSTKKRSENVEAAAEQARQIEMMEGRKPILVKVELDAFYNPNMDQEVKALKAKLERQLAVAQKAEQDAKRQLAKRSMEEHRGGPPYKKIAGQGISQLQKLCDSLVGLGANIVVTEKDAQIALQISNMLSQALLTHRIAAKTTSSSSVPGTTTTTPTPAAAATAAATPPVQQTTNMYSSNPNSYAMNQFAGYGAYGAAPYSNTGYGAYGTYQGQTTPAYQAGAGMYAGYTPPGTTYQQTTTAYQPAATYQ